MQLCTREKILDMKSNRLNKNNPAASLHLLCLVFILTLQGCDQGESKKPTANQVQPTTPTLSYRFCSDKDLIDLPKENEKLVAGIHDEPDGWHIYSYIYEYRMNFFYNLPKAARKLNQGYQISTNCVEMFDCRMKDGSKDPRGDNANLTEICNEGHKITRNYVSKLWHHADSDYFLGKHKEKMCPDPIYREYEGEGSSRKHIQEVLIKGIPMLPTIEDIRERSAFKNDLAALCKVYQETDYCNRNLPEVHELCETITK